MAHLLSVPYDGPEIMGSDGFDPELAALREDAMYAGKKLVEVYVEGEDDEKSDNKLQQVMAKLELMTENVEFRLAGTTATYDEIFDQDTLLRHYLVHSDPVQEALRRKLLKTTDNDYKLIHRPSFKEGWGLSAIEVKLGGKCGYIRGGDAPTSHSEHVLRFESIPRDEGTVEGSVIDVCGSCIVNLICKSPHPYVYFREVDGHNPSPSCSGKDLAQQRARNRARKEKGKRRRARHECA